ncbi:MAG: TRCF domain-containing protein, partial [Pseudomonadota bacterium]|nr:TRCF domain-containing protein [Pseudomonadota bacterium]
HALLSKNISFKRLGLVVVDEEQHFGVAHKERLKNLRNEVHVLTLTATPIPRTLQMAMTGVRDLSIIATPPVDRLAVRTYVSPFDAVSLREALLREKYRAGQSFIIVPRISDITEITRFLSEDVPEVSFIAAHGQMSGGDLEDRMTAFYQGTYDILVSTSIIESGLDIPSVNTIIIHRADRFGLAQLYQMRGRVGRSKTRAYAYLTYNETNGLTESAEKRLKVMQSLDSLGAGFNLASYDLDLRGAGNLVGEEQSGHIKEVGFELYQTMLEEAVANQQGIETDRSWSPQINAGISVMIPETYVPALDLRMGLYRRLAGLEDRTAIDAFAVELVDRFGALPLEVKHLLDILVIKGDCLRAGVEKIDAGPKGAAVFFKDRTFKNVDGLLNYVAQNQDQVKLRPDQSLV